MLLREEIPNLTVKDLKKFIKELHGDGSHLLEKSELQAYLFQLIEEKLALEAEERK